MATPFTWERITLRDAYDLKDIADDVCLEGDIYDQNDDVIVMCRACLEAPAVKRALAGGRYWRDVPFVLRTYLDRSSAVARRQVMRPQARCSRARWFSGFFDQRMSRPRKRLS